MEIIVETTEQDHIDFYKDYGFKRNWIAKVLMLLLIDFIICIYLNSVMLPLIIILAVLLFPFFFVVPYFVLRSKFKRAYIYDSSSMATKIYKPFAIGIEITQNNSEDFLRYEHIKKVGKAGRYIYLILSDGKYFLLPDWCFSSYQDIDHFLRLVRSGVAIAKGGTPREPLTFKPIYLIGLLCIIPLIGAFTGVVLIILGLAHYRDRVFVIMGIVGICITVTLYGSLFYFTKNSGAIESGFAEITQSQINDLVKNIEFYKMQNGAYPDSLKQIETKDSFLSIDDPLQSIKNNGKSTKYQYYKKGNKYLLFSVGKDGIPDTKDDIYPTLSNPDTSKLGFIRR